MACKEPALSSSIVICLGLFLVTTSVCYGKGLTKLKALDKSMGNPTLGHGQTEGRELHHGRLLIGKNEIQVVGVGETETMKNSTEFDKEYQADMGWEGPRQPKGQEHDFPMQNQENQAVEQLLKMEPKVECTRDSMTLQVQDAASYPGSLLFVDRGSSLSPLPLSKLPPSCGYSIQSTRRDLVLVAPYDGCFVSLQEDTYVLPLRWWGLPVRMSCPLMRPSSPNPPMVTCHAEGMIVKTEWAMSTDNIKVKISGDWKPLMTASSTCHFGVVAHPEGVVISVHFAPCLQETDGMYTLELSGDGEIKMSCPSLPPARTEHTKGSVKNPSQQKEVPSKGMHPPAQSQNVAENHAPQTIDQPQHPYFPSYPNFFHPVNPETTPTEKPFSAPEAGKNVGKLQQPVDPPAKQPVPPKGQEQQSFYHYPYYPQPQPATKPSKPQDPKGQVQQSSVTQQEPEKPNAAQKPSQPAAPQGQVYQPYPYYHYPFYSHPEPENKPASEPTAAPETKAPPSQVNQQFYHFPSYPQPETEKHPENPTGAAQPQQPEAPHGQTYQQFYYYPYFHPGQDSEDSVKHPQAPQPEAPKGQAQWPFFPKQDHEEPLAKKPSKVQKPSQPEAPQSPVHPKKEPGKLPATKPSQPEAPKGQVHQQLFHQPESVKQPPAEKPAQPQVPQSPVYPSFYHPYFFHQPKPKNPAAEKPPGAAETQQPSKSAPTQSHEDQFPVYQYPLYPKPDFGKQPATEPTQPPHHEDPEDEMHQPEPEKPAPASDPQPAVPQEQNPFYPNHYPYGYPYSYPFYSQPGPEDQSSKTEDAGTDGDTSNVKNPQQTQDPVYETLPPVSSVKHPHQAISLPSAPENQQPSKGGTDPQTPPNKTPVYCPQYCPSGLSSCCVQIAFHQHLHHILPAKKTPDFYQSLPFLPSMFYPGSNQALVSAPFPEKSTDTTSKASPASPPAPVSSQSPSSVKGNQQFHQPPDGNLDALKGSNPSKQTNQNPIHIVPHPYPPYLPQHEGLKKFPQSQPLAHYIAPSQSQAPSKGQVSQVVQSPVSTSKLVSTEQRPSDIKSSDSGANHSDAEGDSYRHRLLQYLIRNIQEIIANRSQPQHLVRTLQEPNHQPATNANSEPQSYVLLPHGPPGRESYGFNRPPVPSTDFIHDAHRQSYKSHYPQNPSKPEWLGERLPNPLPGNVNTMPRSGDGSSSSWHISAPTGTHFVPLSQDPSFSADNSKPQFPVFWKPMAPGSSGQRVPPLIHPEALQQWGPAADQPQNGLYQPSDKEGGTKK